MIYLLYIVLSANPTDTTVSFICVTLRARSVSRKELEANLSRLPGAKGTLAAMRINLFKVAQLSNLADSRDILVNRKDTAIKSASERYASDICNLIHCLKNKINYNLSH